MSKTTLAEKLYSRAKRILKAHETKVDHLTWGSNNPFGHRWEGWWQNEIFSSLMIDGLGDGGYVPRYKIAGVSNINRWRDGDCGCDVSVSRITGEKTKDSSKRVDLWLTTEPLVRLRRPTRWWVLSDVKSKKDEVELRTEITEAPKLIIELKHLNLGGENPDDRIEFGWPIRGSKGSSTYKYSYEADIEKLCELVSCQDAVQGLAIIAVSGIEQFPEHGKELGNSVGYEKSWVAKEYWDGIDKHFRAMIKEYRNRFGLKVVCLNTDESGQKMHACESKHVLSWNDRLVNPWIRFHWMTFDI